jgi:pentatricopeptide repeat protein
LTKYKFWEAVLMTVLLPNVAASADNAAKEALQKGNACLDNYDYDGAITAFSEVIRLDPKNVSAYCCRGFACGSNGEFDKAIADFSEAIRHDPKCALAYHNRGLAYFGKSNLDKAVPDLDMSVNLRPQSPSYHEARAAVRIHRGDYDGGIVDFHAAIRLDPNDPAAKFENSSKEQLTSEAIQNGEAQVRQMLRDRPKMAQFGDKAGVLYHWAARKFAGEDLHRRILWDPTEPVFTDAAHQSPTALRTGRIRIRKTYSHGLDRGEEQSFEALWIEAVFELYNINSVQDFQRLEHEAAARLLTKEIFVTKMIACECRAVEQTRAFYIHLYLPWAKEQHVSTNPESWYVVCRPDYREDVRPESRQTLLLSHIDRQGTYWRHYERCYDTILLSTLVKDGEYDKAIELVANMQKQAASINGMYRYHSTADGSNVGLEEAAADCRETISLNLKLAQAYYGRAYTHGQKGDHDKAIADYTEAVRLAPTYAEAYHGRGEAYDKKGEKTSPPSSQWRFHVVTRLQCSYSAGRRMVDRLD